MIENPEYAARIVEAAVGCNMVNSALRALLDHQTRDKKLQAQLTQLLSQTERVLPRLVRTADGSGVDALNGTANAAAELGRLLLYLDGPGMAAVIRYAEQLARLASECQRAELNPTPTTLPQAA